MYSINVVYPQISVIIPVYNAEQYLSETLESVLRQTFIDYEVICLDDGSTDASLLILEKYAKKYSNIRVIVRHNTGVVTARNEAIAYARGEYIFPLDSDDLLAPDALQKAYKAMQQKKGDVITFRVMKIGEESEEMELAEPTLANMAIGNCLVNAALFRKKDFEKAGGYDKYFDDCLEDYDLWMNFMFGLRKKIYRIPEILFYYRIKEKKESRNLAGRQLFDEKCLYFRKKYWALRLYERWMYFVHKYFYWV